MLRFATHDLANQFKAFEIFLRPASLVYHALQSFARERAAPTMKGHGHPSTVGMIEDLVGPVAAVVSKPVADER